MAASLVVFLKGAIVTPTLVVGLGSPHGDDQAGWKVIERLGPAPGPGVRTVALGDPSRLWDLLDGCRRLFVVDAARPGREPGTILRLRWPQAGLADGPGRSSHGLGLGMVLALAAQLGRLPAEVILFAVEAASCLPGADLSLAVSAALPQLAQRLLEEIQRPG
jgi:hydrogenase maturation protease